jgi:hypothetical protein
MTYDDDYAFRPIYPRLTFARAAHLQNQARERTAAFRTRFHRKQDCKTVRSAELGRVGRSVPPAREWELKPPRQAAQN